MYKRCVKRLLDILFSIMGLPFFLIIFIILGPIIYFSDRGPVLYVAPRLGKEQRIFKMYKLRSMKVNAPDLRNEDGSTYNSDDDPRVTKIGHILRKTSLDEIPQLLNVLIGDMSWIGPRPDLPDAISLYGPNDFKKLEVRPGITGYSQVYLRNTGDLQDKFKNDMYYAEHINFRLDLKIFIKTLSIVLLQKNLYRNPSEKLGNGKNEDN